ncbi:hypothetical protein NQ314_010161 [Rhamnusium bicolor]|uniref:Alpha-ketoglutarate-dependent dioxygenase AlkB-like domain-containing protein n=1 Tax=Rhamnusium bicolor TaxID=1586634 RepID=A0AAV8XWF0_9CUCU|nr:hypothetical protein NQ314_010161 [Rhamnusium bicolor]
MFKESFKYYKSKNPPPKLDKVFDLNKDSDLKEFQIKKIELKREEKKKFFGLKPFNTWEVFEVAERPGLIFIKNPFTSIGQRYWAVRCLRDYSKKPNKANIDALNLVPESKEWWDMCQNNNNVLLLNKLRWVTLGYHHNWDTKVANLEMDCWGKSKKIFIRGFGQTAIFLLGGKTKEEKPIPVFLRSGDIVIMSKESRLAYHGVPKILQMDSRYWDPINESDISYINKEYKEVVNICKDDESWKPFGDYLTYSRININVRQVLNRGQKRLSNDESENIT